MRLNVLTDHQGNILGMARVGSVQLEDGTELEAGVVPLAGQILHEVEVGDFSTEQIDDVNLYQRLEELIRPRIAGFSQRRTQQG